MTLAALGFDDWFAERAGAACVSGASLARVVAVDRSGCVVRDARGEVPAELTGRLRHEARDPAELPCVGDWVCVTLEADRSRATVEAVLPRRSFLRRKAAGREVAVQMIAANVDVAFVVQACDHDFNLRRLERYLVVCRDGRVEPVVLLTKTDLFEAATVAARVAAIRDAGIDVAVVPLSNATGDGVDEVRRRVRPGMTCCLLGSSGVGKTTLINRLRGTGDLKTAEVSHTGEGRHTTTRRQLFLLEGDRVLIDLPGMRELGVLGTGEALAGSFADVAGLVAACRFGDCSHGSEPGCAVRAAITAGTLEPARWDAWLKLRRESKFHDLSYVEKRRKDREFGRKVRGVLHEKSRRRDG